MQQQRVTVIEEPVAVRSVGEVFCLGLLAFFIPPLAVALVDGCGLNFCINLLLFIFTLWIGAFIHALLVIAMKTTMPESTTIKETTYITERPVQSASMV